MVVVFEFTLEDCRKLLSELTEKRGADGHSIKVRGNKEYTWVLSDNVRTFIFDKFVRPRLAELRGSFDQSKTWLTLKSLTGTQREVTWGVVEEACKAQAPSVLFSLLRDQKGITDDHRYQVKLTGDQCRSLFAGQKV